MRPRQRNSDDIDEDVPLDKNTNSLGQKYTIGAQLVSDDETNCVGTVLSQIASYHDDIITASVSEID